MSEAVKPRGAKVPKGTPRPLRRLARVVYRLRENILAGQRSLVDLWPNATVSDNLSPLESVALPTPPADRVLDSHESYLLSKVEFPAGRLSTIRRALYLPRTNVIAKNWPRRTLAENLTSANNLLGTPRELISRSHIPLEKPGAVFRQNSLGYAHTVLDNLTRLLLIYRGLDALGKGGIDLLCGSPELEPERALVSAIFPDNVRLRPLDCSNTYLVDQLVFPDLVCRNLMLPQWAKSDLRAAFRCSDTFSDKRILVSRSDAGRRRLLNEQDLFEALKPYGFEMVVPGNLSFSEQAGIFSSAKMIVGVHGAGLANTAFSQNYFLLELFPNPEIQPAFWLLGLNSGIDYHFLTDQQRGRHDNFEIPVADVLQVLRRHRVI